MFFDRHFWLGQLGACGRLFQRAPLSRLTTKFSCSTMKSYSKKGKITTRPEIGFVQRVAYTKIGCEISQDSTTRIER
ncbi:MAG: hypothetical protein ACJASZ_001544 [Yoonia sp.]|jgi:hypothetical protein